MTSTIITKNSSTASSVPLAADLTQGELAVNVTDKKLYSKDSGGSVVKLVGSLGNQEANAAAITGGTINGTAIGGTTAAAVSATTLSASGAVTLSGGTANGVAYLNGSKVLTSGSALTFDGTNFSIGGGSNSSRFNVTNGSSGGFEVNPDGTNSGPTLIAYNRTGAAYLQLTATALNHVWQNSGTETMRLTSTGLGIGTSSPNSAGFGKGVEVYSAASSAASIVTGGSNSYSWVVSSDTNAFRAFKGTTELMRLDSASNLLVGTTSAPAINVKGSALQNFANQGRLAIGATVSNADLAYFYSSTALAGAINVNGSVCTYTSFSDYRLKEDVAPMTGALTKVAALKPVTYKWKTDGSAGQGFIAHELQAVVPECVTGEKDAVDEEGNPKYQGIDTSFLVATLTAAIQELKAEFDAYKASHP